MLNIIEYKPYKDTYISYVKGIIIGEKIYTFDLSLTEHYMSADITFKINGVDVLEMSNNPYIGIHNLHFGVFFDNEFTETHEVIRILKMFKSIFGNEYYWDDIIKKSIHILKEVREISKGGE